MQAVRTAIMVLPFHDYRNAWKHRRMTEQKAHVPWLMSESEKEGEEGGWSGEKVSNRQGEGGERVDRQEQRQEERKRFHALQAWVLR